MPIYPVSSYQIKMKKWLLDKITNQEFVTILTTLIGVYYTFYKTFPQWSCFVSYPLINTCLFIIFGFVLILLPVTKYFCGKNELVDIKKSNIEIRNANKTLMSFNEMLYKIVSKKVFHFKEQARNLKNKYTFEQITTPDERIQTLFEESSDFITKSYGIDKDDLDITILSKYNSTDWSYYKKHHSSWVHRNANDLFTQNSSASQSIQRGEVNFFPSKLEASKRGEYVLSEKDTKSNGSGSIFVYPVSLDCAGNKYEYIISIVTYLCPFAPENDTTAIASAKVYLEQISKRIELELCLRSIKHAKTNKSSKQTKPYYEPVPRKQRIIL